MEKTYNIQNMERATLILNNVALKHVLLFNEHDFCLTPDFRATKFPNYFTPTIWNFRTVDAEDMQENWAFYLPIKFIFSRYLSGELRHFKNYYSLAWGSGANILSL